jgi:hypothetical protein
VFQEATAELENGAGLAQIVLKYQKGLLRRQQRDKEASLQVANSIKLTGVCFPSHASMLKGITSSTLYFLMLGDSGVAPGKEAKITKCSCSRSLVVGFAPVSFRGA